MVTARPRILFNAVQSKVGGGRVFLEEVAPRLCRHSALDWLVLARPEQSEDLAARGCPVVQVHPPPGGAAIFRWNQTALPPLARRLGASMVFTPANVGSLTLGRRSATLLRNSFEAAASWTGWRNRLHWTAQRVLTGWSIRRAGWALVVSASFRDEVVAKLRVPAEWLEVVHHGISAGLRPTGPVAPSAAPYVLVVGDVYPHKNLEGAIAAFARLAPEHPTLELVFAGREIDAAYAGRMRALARELGVDERTRWLGWQERDSVGAWFRGASVALGLSVAETFGITQIEAMACGAPLVVADLPYAREISGDAALFVPPRDPVAVASAVGRVVADPELRARLVRDGLARATGFTWDRCADRTAAAIGRRVAAIGIRGAGA